MHIDRGYYGVPKKDNSCVKSDRKHFNNISSLSVLWMSFSCLSHLWQDRFWDMLGCFSFGYGEIPDYKVIVVILIVKLIYNQKEAVCHFTRMHGISWQKNMTHQRFHQWGVLGTAWWIHWDGHFKSINKIESSYRPSSYCTT